MAGPSAASSPHGSASLPRARRALLEAGLGCEELWDGNGDSFRSAFLSRNLLILFTLRHFRGRRRRYPGRFAHYEVVRLRSQAEIDVFLRSVAPAT